MDCDDARTVLGQLTPGIVERVPDGLWRQFCAFTLGLDFATELTAFWDHYLSFALIKKKDNILVAGKSYSVKVAHFKKFNSQPLTKAIARDYPKTFGKTEVEARQSYLADLALKTWPITVK